MRFLCKLCASALDESGKLISRNGQMRNQVPTLKLVDPDHFQDMAMMKINLPSELVLLYATRTSTLTELMAGTKSSCGWRCHEM